MAGFNSIFAAIGESSAQDREMQLLWMENFCRFFAGLIF
jgi:hypothetical protein